MPNVFLSAKALNDFMYWAHNDRKILDKIDKLLDDIERNGAAKGVSASPNALNTKTATRGESTTSIGSYTKSRITLSPSNLA